MWLDRLSNHPTRSASPPPGRNSLQAPRRSSQFAPSSRPTYSPRSSSLNVAKFNASTASLNSPRILPSGSTLRQELVLPAEQSDPLAVLEQIVGKPVSRERDGERLPKDALQRPDELVEAISFGDRSLTDFVEESGLEVEPYLYNQTEEEYIKDSENFEKLHKSILACDDVLISVETSLTNFQNDLGAVSAEIENLQNRSTGLSRKLENRKKVEKLLGPAVEEISVPPTTIKRLVEGSVDREWLEALRILEQKSKAINEKSGESDQVTAISDVKPLLDDLTNLAIERIRDYLVAQIKSLRSPNINARVIQQRGFLAYREIFSFLARHHPKLAEEIGQAYVNTMRWYYSSHFARYKQSLEKASIYAVDKTDALGVEPNQKSSSTVPHAPTPLMLGRRIDIITRPPQSALPAYLAEDAKAPIYLETPFHAFNTALIDNATFEYAFLTTFFSHLPFSQLNAHFNTIFGPTFTVGETFTKHLTDTQFDCFGILLCVRITQHLAFELQRRKCPAADSYINGTNMLLWPRFQIAVDAHVEGLKKATASLPSSSVRATLTLGGGGGGSGASRSGGAGDDSGGKGSTAPHMLTQRFGQFLQGILALVGPSSSSSTSTSSTEKTRHQHQRRDSTTTSSGGIDTVTTPISRSLSRLRAEFETFLDRAARPVTPASRKERFLCNNYGLVRTIVGDEVLGVGGGAGSTTAGGGLGSEVAGWLEGKIGDGAIG